MLFDVGRIGGASAVNTPGQGWFKDIGIGPRIGNSRSGPGSVVHVDPACPLDASPSMGKIQLLVQTKQRFGSAARTFI